MTSSHSFPSMTSGRVILNRYIINKTIKAGEMFQLLEVKDTVQGDIKVVKILVRARISERALANDIAWIKKKLSNLPNQRSNPFYQESRDLTNYYLVFNRNPYSLKDALEDDNLYISRRHAIEIAAQMTHGLSFLHADLRSHVEISPQYVELIDGEIIQESFYDNTDHTFKSRNVLHSTKLAISFYGKLGLCDTVNPGVEQYRSPEAVYGLGVRIESDVFSLGCVIAEVLKRRPLFLFCNDGPLYKREKAALFDTILGPFPDWLTREIRQSVTGGFQYPMLHPTLDSTISRTVSEFIAGVSSLEHMFTNAMDREVIEDTTRLDYTRRVQLEDLKDYAFFASLDD